MGCVPKLRFPKFSGDWEEIRGKEIFDVLGGGAFSSKDSRDNGVKWFKIANVGINKIKSTNVSYLPIEYQKEYEKYLLKTEDIVIALTRPTLSSKLKIALVDDYFDNSLLNQRVGKLIHGKNGIKNFIYYILQLKKNIDYIENQISGTDPPNLSIKDLINIPLMVPSVIEQEKIASFLSKVDSKIEKLEEKQELWETYKKGIMQQIFSQNLRFKDENGEDYPDWEEKKLIDCCIFIRDGTHGSFKDHENGIPLLSAKDIDSGKITLDNEPRTISHADYDLIHKKYKIKEGDILLTIVGTIGRVAIVKTNKRFTLQRSVAIIRLEDEVDSNYLYFYFNSYNFQKSLKRAVNLSAQGGVYLGSLNKINVLIPIYSEQTKIVNFLSSIEKKIFQVDKELELNKEFKKGLLQQMFC